MKNIFLIAMLLSMVGCAQLQPNGSNTQQPQNISQNQPVLNCLGDRLNITFVKSQPYSNGRVMSVENFYDNPSWMVAYLQRHPEQESTMKSWLMAEVKKGGPHGTKAYSVLGLSGMMFDNKMYSADYYYQTRKLYTSGVQNYCEPVGNMTNYNPYIHSVGQNPALNQYYAAQQYSQQPQYQGQYAQPQYQGQYQQYPQYAQPQQKQSLMQGILKGILGH